MMYVLTEERQQRILDYLATEKIVKSHDLVTRLQTSESTIRRDLRDLEAAGKLIRIHGGAKLIAKVDAEENLLEKSVKNTQEKQLIAQAAASLVKDQDIIYLDAGSTTYEMIPYLKNKDLLVVTNSVKHATLLADYQLATIIIGGMIKLSTQAIIGAHSVKQLEQFRLDHAFMGMNNLHADYGYTTPDIEEATMKRTAMNQAENVWVLVDHTKFGGTSFAQVAPLDKATILTDYCPKEVLASVTQKTTIKEFMS